MKKLFLIILIIKFLFRNFFAKSSVFEKIDLFGEVLEKIKKDYVDEVDESDMMDSAINGVLQSLDPYSAYMSPETFKDMQTDTKGEFGGLGIEIGMEAGVVKVISPIDDTPAAKAGIKAGDYIIKLIMIKFRKITSRSCKVDERSSRNFHKFNCKKTKRKKTSRI